jgi:hypothetical protein
MASLIQRCIANVRQVVRPQMQQTTIGNSDDDYLQSLSQPAVSRSNLGKGQVATLTPPGPLAPMAAKAAAERLQRATIELEAAQLAAAALSLGEGAAAVTIPSGEGADPRKAEPAEVPTNEVETKPSSSSGDGPGDVVAGIMNICAKPPPKCGPTAEQQEEEFQHRVIAEAAAYDNGLSAAAAGRQETTCLRQETSGGPNRKARRSATLSQEYRDKYPERKAEAADNARREEDKRRTAGPRASTAPSPGMVTDRKRSASPLAYPPGDFRTPQQKAAGHSCSAASSPWAGYASTISVPVAGSGSAGGPEPPGSFYAPAKNNWPNGPGAVNSNDSRPGYARNKDGYRYHNMHQENREHRHRPTDVSERTFVQAVLREGAPAPEASLPDFVSVGAMPGRLRTVLVDYHNCLDEDPKVRRGLRFLPDGRPAPKISTRNVQACRQARVSGLELQVCSAVKNVYGWRAKEVRAECADAEARYLREYKERLWKEAPILQSERTGDDGKAMTARAVGACCILDDRGDIIQEAWDSGIRVLPVQGKHGPHEGPWIFHFRTCAEALVFAATRWNDLRVIAVPKF